MLRRTFHSTSEALAKTKYTRPKPKPKARKNVKPSSQLTHHNKNLSLQAPIPPAAANIEVSEQHPLWQFFSDKKYMRTFEELDTTSRPWTVSELRRKSFDDLHSLWYSCLKERNILARENHLLKNGMEAAQDNFENVAEQVRTTMWRIRHVLSERDHAFNIAKNTDRQAFLEEFKTEFLASEDSETDLFDQLTRFQYAVFGISEYVSNNTVDRTFVDGVKFIANLKAQRYAKTDAEIAKIYQELGGKLDQVMECFVVFNSDMDLASMKKAMELLAELRKEKGLNEVSRYDEINVMKDYINQMQEKAAAESQ